MKYDTLDDVRERLDDSAQTEEAMLMRDVFTNVAAPLCSAERALRSGLFRSPAQAAQGGSQDGENSEERKIDLRQTHQTTQL